jgi:long-chain acyl-CoA synthetase
MIRIELVSRIEEWLGVCVEESQITPDLTVAALEALLQSKAPVLTHLIPYPRWSLLPWAGRVRPLAIRLFLQSWIPLCCRLQVEGLEHLAELTGPAIFMANHRSYLDGAIATLALPTRFRSRLSIAAATDVLYRQYPWAVPLVELTFNAFPLPTGIQENIQAGFNYIGRLLDDGWGVLLFPEGQMNRRDGSLMRLKGGTGVIAVEMQAPVIPMTIEGTEKIMPPGRLLPRSKGLVRIRFGRPLYFDAGMSFNGATAEIEDAMRGLLEEQALVIHHGGN